MIELRHDRGDEWVVTVNAAVTTTHKVIVSSQDVQRLAHGRGPEELIRESFRFLLEREPNTSILRSFELPVIGRYFPEYEESIRVRLVKQ